MEKILDRLYSYALENEDLGKVYIHDEEKYEEESKIYDELESTFTKKQIELFNKFIALYMERKYFEDKKTFQYAFKKGVRLAFEVFEDKRV